MCVGGGGMESSRLNEEINGGVGIRTHRELPIERDKQRRGGGGGGGVGWGGEKASIVASFRVVSDSMDTATWWGGGGGLEGAGKRRRLLHHSELSVTQWTQQPGRPACPLLVQHTCIILMHALSSEEIHF